MGKPSAPAAPDPVKTAQAQTASNRETAITQTGLNAINQYGPQGSVTYAQNGTWADGTPRFTQTTSLSPTEQAVYNATSRTRQNLASVGERQSQSIGNLLATPFNTNGLPAAGNTASINAPSYQQYGSGPSLNTTGGDASGITRSLSASDYSSDRQKVEDALMGRLNTQIDRDRQAMEASLANRGIRLGSQAYSNAMQDFDRGVAENRTSAILGAGQEQNRLQQLDMNARGFANTAQQQAFEQQLANAGFGNSAQQQMFQNTNATTAANNALGDQRFANQQSMFNLQNAARNQAMNERLTTRNQALNENIGLATGTQVSLPAFGGTPQTGVAGTDIAGINANANNANMAAYNSQMGQWNSTMGGLFGLGANALMAFSDERLKKNARSTGLKLAGVPIKSFEWKGSGQPDVGVMAQDVERKHPELVDKSHPSGMRRVNYGGLMRLGRAA
jgi:hypothetical protein